MLLRPRTIAILFAAVGLPLAVFFGRPLLRGEVFVYRDAAHFYYPQERWLAAEWSAGRVPLWNPLENCGTPVLAEPTAAVFYPGKLLFALPLPFATNYMLYLAAHAILAAVNAFALARHWRASAMAAGMCGLSFAFGGPVLFQCCNAVFLVGAAWLPLAVLLADRMVVRRDWFDAMKLGAVLALMVLGGDPQMAYHAGLIAAAFAFTRGLSWFAPRTNVGSQSEPRRWRRPFFLLSLSAATMLALAAVQLGPTFAWSRQSSRTMHSAPRTVFEAAASLRSDDGDQRLLIAEGLIGMPEPGTHHSHIYEFSIGQWRLAELFWPGFSGQAFPQNRRWTTAIPAEGRAWTPSLYVGLAPLLLAIFVGWRRGDEPRQRILRWLTLIGVLGSFGGYGIGWLVHEIFYAVGRDDSVSWLGPQVGGLYWLLVTFLPGYVEFRFPAKLFTLAALGLSVLAARGLDRLTGCESEKTAPSVDAWRRLMWAAIVVAASSVAGWLATFTFAPWWANWLHGAPADPLLGPLDAAGALRLLRGSLLQAAIISGGIIALLQASRRRPSAAATIGPLQLLVSAVDLIAAHAAMLPTAPAELWETRSPIAAAIRQDRIANAGNPISTGRLFRRVDAAWFPTAWQTSSSPNRQRDGLRWDRATLFPKYQFLEYLSEVQSQTTLTQRDFHSLWQHAAIHRARLDLLGAEYLVLPPEATLPRADRIGLVETEVAAGTDGTISLWRNRDALPRAWVVYDITGLPPLPSSASPAALRSRTEAVFFSGGQPRDFRRQAVVEGPGTRVERGRISAVEYLQEIRAFSRENIVPADRPQEGTPDPLHSCRLISDAPQRIVLDVTLTRPGLLVLNDQFEDGWQVIWEPVDGSSPRQKAAIWRTNRVQRGVFLPAGHHKVLFRYRPATVFRGLAISGTSWLLLAVCGVLRMWATRFASAHAARRCV